MLIDGISLVDSSVIANTHIESGTAFPTSASLGRMFYLNATVSGNEPGLYVYNGSAWVTGDITKITVGSGLTGGGSRGDISLGIDTAVVATKTYADSGVAVVQSRIDALTKADVGLGLVENKSSATIRSEITSSNVTTALGFTPYNATNPSSYINLTQARQGIGAGTGISYDSTTGFVSLSATTSLVAEGTNLYFTNARASAAAPVQSVAGRTGAVVLSTTDVSEGSRLYYTDARARAAISATGNIAYNSTTGVISFTIPTTGAGSGDFKADGSVAMTGAITLPADPTLALQAATKQYVDTKVAVMDGGTF